MNKSHAWFATAQAGLSVQKLFGAYVYCYMLYRLEIGVITSCIVLSCPVFVSVCLIMCNFIGLNPRLRTHVFMFRRRMCVYTGLKFYPNNLNGVKF